MHGQQSRPLRATEPHNNRRRIDQQTAAKSHQSGRSPHELPHSRSAQANERKNEGWRAIAQTNKRANEHARASKRTCTCKQTNHSKRTNTVQCPSNYNTRSQHRPPTGRQPINQPNNQPNNQTNNRFPLCCVFLTIPLPSSVAKEVIHQCTVQSGTQVSEDVAAVSSWKLEAGSWKEAVDEVRSFVRLSSIDF